MWEGDNICKKFLQKMVRWGLDLQFILLKKGREGGWDMQLIHVLFQKYRKYVVINWLTRAVTGPGILEEI